MMERTGARHEWTLWVTPVACALHALDEYLSGWQAWASVSLGISMPTTLFVVANAVLVAAAAGLARLGWKGAPATLVIPAATLVNAVFFHILPTVVQGRPAPGILTSVLLYVPFSSWALAGAWRDGVRGRSIVAACVAGALMMFAVASGARLLSPGQ